MNEAGRVRQALPQSTRLLTGEFNHGITNFIEHDHCAIHNAKKKKPP